MSVEPIRMFDVHIPYLNYVKVLFLYGYPSVGEKSVEDVLLRDDFNSVGEKILNRIYENMLKDDDYKDMMVKNKAIYKAHCEGPLPGTFWKGKPFYINRKAINKFFMRDIADAMSTQVGVLKTGNGTVQLSRLFKLLRTYSDRSVVEVMIMHDFSVGDIFDAIITQYGSMKYMPYVLEDISAYKYYFWNCDYKGLSDNGCDKDDLCTYLTIDRYNKLYNDHMLMGFISKTDVLYSIGEVDAQTRQQMTKKIYGRAAVSILDSMRKGDPIKDSYLTVYKHTDGQMYEQESGKSANETFKDAFGKFIAKIDEAQSKRLSMEDLMNQKNPSGENAELPEQDEPVVVEKK